MDVKPKNTTSRQVFLWFKRILFSVLILLILLVAIVPFLFKDEIISSVRTAISERIEGDFTFADADVGLITSFPDFCLAMHDVVITGKELPDVHDSLLIAQDLEITIDLWSVIKKDRPLVITGLRLQKPTAHFIIAADGTANYDIVSYADTTDTAETSSFNLDIEEYRLSDASITYWDVGTKTRVEINALDHTGTLQYSENIAEMQLSIERALFSVDVGNVTYLRDVHVQGGSPVSINLDSSMYRIARGDLTFNDLGVLVRGDIQVLEDVLFDLQFTSARNAFKDFLSVLPNAYTDDFDQVEAEGDLQLSGSLTGTYSGIRETVPIYRVNLVVDDGSFKYPEKELAFREINIKGNAENTQASWNPEMVHLETFSLVLNGTPLTGTLKGRDLNSEKKLSGSVVGKVNLADFSKAYPVGGIDALTGIIDANVEFSVSAHLPPGQQTVSGSLTLSDCFIHSSTYQLSVRKAICDFSPQRLTVHTSDALLNFHPFSLSLTAVNLVPWYMDEDSLQLSGAFEAQRLAIPATSDEDEATPVNPSGLPARLQLDLLVHFDTLQYATWTFTPLHGKVIGNLDRLKIQNARGHILNTQFTGSGHVSNLYGYLYRAEELGGTFTVRADDVQLNSWMSTSGEATADTATSAEAYVQMPESVNIQVRYTVDRLYYDKLRINNVTGFLEVMDRAVMVSDLQARGLGGDIRLGGLYRTLPGEAPDFNLKYDLSKLQFKQAFEQARLFAQIAPIAEFIEGQFNSTLVMEGKLGKGYLPDLQTLTAEGYIETIHSKLSELGLLEKISRFLNIDPPIDWNLAYTRNWFEIRNGTVEIKEFSKNFGDIEATIAGSHQIKGPMQYSIALAIPEERITSNPVGELAKQGFGEMQSKLSQLGVKLRTVETVHVNLGITGSITDPELTIRSLSLDKQTLDETVRQTTEEVKQQLEDTARTIVREKVQTAKDSAMNLAGKAADSLKEVAKEKISEAKEELAKGLRDKLPGTPDSTVTGQTDSTKADLPDVLGEKTEKEIDKIKGTLDNWDPFKKKKKDN